MTPAEALAYLDSHTNLGIKPGLERMQAAMALLGEPQREYPVIHVTGTNGKSTVARLCASVLDEFGIATGSYTSPHLLDVYERIEVRGSPISPEAFASQLGELVPYFDEVERVTGSRPSYFEIGTVLALAYFADVPVGAAVVEVGLGGALDATNVVDGVVAVVTNVERDHVEYLGADLVGICREKAGIIKAGATVVTGVEDAELLGVIEARCAEVGADALWRLGEEVRLEGYAQAVGGIAVDVATPNAAYEGLFVPLLGPHQATNAALAVAAVDAFFDGGVDAGTLAVGLAAARSPGRLEVVANRPLVVLDGAHNPAGARALRTAVEDVFHYDRLVLVIGALADKDAEGIVRELAGTAALVVATTSGDDRSLSPETLAGFATAAGVEAVAVPDVRRAIETAKREAGAHGLVLVAGSLYLVGAAKRVLAHSSKTGPA